MRLIDADKIEYSERYDGQGFTRIAYGDDIDDLPTINSELVRHGKWIEHKDYPGLAYLCSECSYFTTSRSYYCPHCGAKMDGSRVMATTNLTVPITINWKDIEEYLAQHDIMEVVRCRYCANNPKRSFLGCPMRNNPDRKEDDYCSYWERGTNEN